MFTLRLVSSRILFADVWLFEFERPRWFAWHPGNHVVMFVGDQSRPLTIASAPHEKTLLFVTHCPADGSIFKNTLRTMEWGDTVQVTEPGGTFMLHNDKGPFQLVAAGIGIGAFRAMLVDLHHRGMKLSGSLDAYGPDGQVPFHDEIQAIAAAHPEFTVRFHDATNLHEKGGLEEIERNEKATRYMSGVYVRSAGASQLAHIAAHGHDEERNEAVMLQKAAGLID
jgi:ferredoxin-NADP reductase